MIEPAAVGDAAEIVHALTRELSEHAVVVDPDIVEAYRHDRARTIVPGTPLALVRARDTADVQATMRVADRYGVPVVPRGAGTGLAGHDAALREPAADVGDASAEPRT